MNELHTATLTQSVAFIGTQDAAALERRIVQIGLELKASNNATFFPENGRNLEHDDLTDSVIVSALKGEAQAVATFCQAFPDLSSDLRAAQETCAALASRQSVGFRCGNGWRFVQQAELRR